MRKILLSIVCFSVFVWGNFAAETNLPLMKLAHPSVAARLGLSDAQRAEVQKILAERAQLLAKAPEADWQKIIAENEKKLEAVLTPAQKTYLPKVFNETTIRINFKLQSWADVLQWVAEQAGLQLVMDAPPPGTFNYADQKDYTPAEAVNLLNGWLQIKGFTLVRNDKMLMLFDLKRGKIPLQYLPKLKPEELPERQTFEYTTVTFPLERRDQNVVIASMEPFKGPFCQIIPMPGNALMITDTAGTLLMLQKVIADVNNPAAPAGPKEEKAKSDPPVWKPYPLKKVDGAFVEAAVVKFLPTATVVREPTSKTVLIYVPETQHKIIEQLVSMLDTGTEGATPPVVEAYDITIFSGIGTLETLLSTLRKSFPNAVFGDALLANKLVVLATPEDQQKIAVFAESLKKTTQDTDTENVVFVPKHIKAPAAAGILEKIYPAAKVTNDPAMNKVVIQIRKEQKNALQALLNDLDTEDTGKKKPYLKSYPYDPEANMTAADGSLYTVRILMADLQRLAPKARIAFEDMTRQLFVWAEEEEHKIIGDALRLQAGDKKVNKDSKRFEQYPLRRIRWWDMYSVIHRLYPRAVITYDYSGRSLILEDTPENLKKIGELIQLLDPEKPSPNDPVLKYYTLKEKVTPQIISMLNLSVPEAVNRIYQTGEHQIAVIVKPFTHALIEKNLGEIESTQKPAEEPMFVLYPCTMEERAKLRSFIQTATAQLKSVSILPDRNPVPQVTAESGTPPLVVSQQMGVWAKPSEHVIVAEFLKQIREGKANETPRQVKVFYMSVADMAATGNLLRSSHPDAFVFPDKPSNRLTVLATPDELERVTKTLEQQGSIDNREMLAYPVAGTDVKIAMQVVKDVFQGLKITPEPQTKRILVWASPEEHTKVAEIVEQVNKKEKPDSELAEKFIAYSSKDIDAVTFTQLFKTMFPEADIFNDAGAGKFIVKARTREHAQVKQMFEELQKKDVKEKRTLAVFNFGEAEAANIEAMMHSLMKNADSMTSDEILYRLSVSLYYERLYKIYYSNPNTPKAQGFYRVDPATQSVSVYGTAEELQEVGKSVKELIAAAEKEGKPVMQYYVFNEISYFDADRLLQKTVPSATFEPVYVNVPAGQDWRASYREFTAFATETDHKKIAALVKELNERSGQGKKELLTLTLPEKTPYSREQVMTALMQLYPDASPAEGGSIRQILVWAVKAKLDLIQETFNEICKPVSEEYETEVRSFPLKYITVAEAKEWLRKLFPNVTVDPASKKPGVALPLPAGSVRTDKGEVALVSGTLLELLQVEKALKELDKDLPDGFKRTPRTYNLDDMTIGTAYWLYVSLLKAFPSAVSVPDARFTSVMTVADENEHQKIETFIKKCREDLERKRPAPEVYALKNLNFGKIYGLIQRIAPAAMILPGAQTGQIFIWGTPKEQADVAAALAKLEAATELASTSDAKLYKTGTNKAAYFRQLLTSWYPGCFFMETGPSELLTYASPVDHKNIAALLKTVAEAFPEPVVKIYSLKHIQIYEAWTFLSQAFAERAVITPRWASSDLVVYALPEVQELVAESVKDVDKPKPAGTERIAVAYDLSDLAEGYLPWVQNSIQTALNWSVTILPAIEPGQMVVWGRLAEQDKVREIVEQVLKERPATSSKMQSYVLERGYAHSASLVVQQSVPNAKLSIGIKPNQLLVWAKDSDQSKVKSIIDSLNNADESLTLQTYSLKNIYTNGIQQMLLSVFQQSGSLDTKLLSYDPFNKMLVIQANPATHKLIDELLEKFKLPEREMAVIPLEVLDTYTAGRAIYTLFYDESIALTPSVDSDANTNTLFVLGTKEQLTKVRQKLREMGENVKPAVNHEKDTGKNDSVSAPAVPDEQRSLNIRTLTLPNADTLKQLEKQWKQTQSNELRVMKENDEPKGMFSVEEEISRDKEAKKETGQETEKKDAAPSPEVKTEPPVYIIENADGTVTISSQDTAALDKLETMLKRLKSNVVFEGRDFSVFSVRNVSADIVSYNLKLILQTRLTAQGYGRLPLTIEPNLSTNTLYVRGPKMDRNEVAKLIDIFDVSELPGERMVTKPVRITIQNTQAIRVYYQIWQVYGQKMWTTRLPGGQYPQIYVDALTNSLEIIAPEPLLTELKEYAEDVDKRVVSEPGRKIHVIPLGVKSSVIQQAIQRIQMSGAASGGR